MMKKFAACRRRHRAGRRAAALAQQAGHAGGCRPSPPTDDRYIGYYYPKPTSTESLRIADADHRRRRSRRSACSSSPWCRRARSSRPIACPTRCSSRATRPSKLIIVGLQPGELGTIYRMRALLANMTTMSRLSPFFQERTVAEDADLLRPAEDAGLQASSPSPTATSSRTRSRSSKTPPSERRLSNAAACPLAERRSLDDLFSGGTSPAPSRTCRRSGRGWRRCGSSPGCVAPTVKSSSSADRIRSWLVFQ